MMNNKKMSNVSEYKINDEKYYVCDDLMVIYPKLFTGCENSRSYVRNNDIEYVYARDQNGSWQISTGKNYKLDKVMIKKEWFNQKYKKEYLDDDDNNSFAYLITSAGFTAVKIGMWKGSVYQIRKKYAHYYGDDFELYFVTTNDTQKLVEQCHNTFINYKLSGDLFNKKYHSDYRKFIDDNK